MRHLIIAAALALAAPAAGAPVRGPGEAVKALNAGDWKRADELGRKQGDVLGAMVAARSALVRAAYYAGSRAEAEALLTQADGLVARGVDDAPDDFYVKLMEALAIGYRATLNRSRTGSLRARALMTELAEDHPDRIEGWMALGAWHGEATIRAGFLAKTVLGATRAKMEQNLASAAARDPSDPLAPAYRGLFLVRMEEEAAARPYLRQAAGLKPRDAYEAMYRKNAIEVDRLLAAGDIDGARKRAAELAPFGRFDPAYKD